MLAVDIYLQVNTVFCPCHGSLYTYESLCRARSCPKTVLVGMA